MSRTTPGLFRARDYKKVDPGYITASKEAGVLFVSYEGQCIPEWPPATRRSKLDEAKERLAAAAFKLLRGPRVYQEHIQQASRCPSALQAREASDIFQLNVNVEEEFVEAIHSQLFEEAQVPEELQQVHQTPAWHPSAIDEWEINPHFTHVTQFCRFYGPAFGTNGHWPVTDGRHLKWPIPGDLNPVRLMASLLWVDLHRDTVKEGDWPVVPSQKFLQMVNKGQRRDPLVQARIDDEPWMLDTASLIEACDTMEPLHNIVNRMGGKQITQRQMRLMYHQLKMVRRIVRGAAAVAPPPPPPPTPFWLWFLRLLGGDAKYQAQHTKNKADKIALAVRRSCPSFVG